MQDKQVFPLSKITEAIERVINRYCNKVIWIKAEIVKLNYYPHTGHCYPELVEKHEGKVVAEIRGNIWKTRFDLINSKFRSVLNEDLGDDMTVVIQATVTYNSVYGLALNILDIDPEFTLGELARQKMETVKRLQAENIFEANKSTFLPLIPKTLAIVSVSSSKGYQDFLSVMENNPWNYQYHHLLFPAILQGERAVATIVGQLENIRNYPEVFDAVVILRGGGGDIGLSCYDSYKLARAIAEFPIPVLTGIGHSTNETVSELVSYRSFITPTKIAEFLLQEYHNFATPLKEGIEVIKNQSIWLLEKQYTNLKETSRLFSSISSRILDRNKNNLEHLEESIFHGSKNILKDQNHELKILSGSITQLSPQNILKRGFSITRLNGKIIKNPSEVQAGDDIITEVYSGSIYSTVGNSAK